ncbi:MAG: MBL fold metallo-hydrolase [Bacilli bacterium]
MKIRIIASGSKGNSTYIECNGLKILVDVGVSFSQIKNSLLEINIDISDINIVLITHSHNDHTKGLSTLLNQCSNIVVCTIPEVYLDLVNNLKLKISKYILLDEDNVIENVLITSIRTSHDVPSSAYIIKGNSIELVYITDTGYLNRKYFEKLSNKDVYIIESNYDETMLMNGPYPFVLKQRILSDKGHLSNKATAKILARLIGDNTKYIFLAHISEHNNTKQLAFHEIKKELSSINFDLDKVILTDQYISLEMVEI